MHKFFGMSVTLPDCALTAGVYFDFDGIEDGRYTIEVGDESFDIVVTSGKSSCMICGKHTRYLKYFMHSLMCPSRIWYESATVNNKVRSSIEYSRHSFIFSDKMFEQQKEVDEQEYLLGRESYLLYNKSKELMKEMKELLYG